MKKDVLIGGAWPYANNLLHTRYLISLLPGDVLAKYYRGKGDNVIYISGSDCFGTPITERAKKERKTPKEIATYYHQELEKTFDRMGFEFDKYSLTMSENHQKYVSEQLKLMVKNGYVYQKGIKQDYCETCHTFLSDREIVGICPYCGGKSLGDQCTVCSAPLNSHEVLDKHCKVCNSETVKKGVKHLYFRLTSFENDIKNLLEQRKTQWRPNALKEAYEYIGMGLADRVITRQLDWGIKAPFVGYDDKRVYVWFEALLSYLSLGSEVATTRGIDFDKFLSEENPNLVTYFVHGKDNIQFHTVIFPAIMKALKKNYHMPDYMISSNFISLEDEKNIIGTGNFITINSLLDIFSKDTLRFYSLFNGPEEKDTTYSSEEMIQYHNEFLHKKVDYFVTRTLKKYDCNISNKKIDERMKEETKKAYDVVGSFIEKGQFKNAISAILDYVNLGNTYYDAMQPWIQYQASKEVFEETMYTCAYMVANLANLFHPFLPGLSQHIREFLNLGDYKWEEVVLTEDITLKDGEPYYDEIGENEKKEIDIKIQMIKGQKN